MKRRILSWMLAAVMLCNTLSPVSAQEFSDQSQTIDSQAVQIDETEQQQGQTVQSDGSGQEQEFTSEKENTPSQKAGTRTAPEPEFADAPAVAAASGEDGLDDGMVKASRNGEVRENVSYYQEGVQHTDATCTVITEIPGSLGTEGSRTPVWYLFEGTKENTGAAIEIKGNVHLILANNSNYTVRNIRVGPESSLTIYSQTNDSSNEGVKDEGITGKLTAYGKPDNNSDGNNIYTGAGIGGIAREGAGNITIHGGTINARAYHFNPKDINTPGAAPCGAAIGGGNKGGFLSITVTGGTVNAYCDWASGIGCGKDCSDSVDGSGNIIITGGKVIASSGQSYGIGSRYGKIGNITVSGGNIEAKGNGGIGGKFNNIEIFGGTVVAETTAPGGAYSTESGIGGSKFNSIRVTGGNVTAKSFEGAAIGSSKGAWCSAGKIYVTGGNVIANAKFGGGIGQGNNSKLGEVYVIGPNVTASSVSGNVGIRPIEANVAYEIFGNKESIATVEDNWNVPAGVTWTIRSGVKLKIPDGMNFTIEGTIYVDAGAELDWTHSSEKIIYREPSKVEVTVEGTDVDYNESEGSYEVPYGSDITITATISKANEVNARDADAVAGKVDFYWKKYHKSMSGYNTTTEHKLETADVDNNTGKACIKIASNSWKEYWIDGIFKNGEIYAVYSGGKLSPNTRSVTVAVKPLAPAASEVTIDYENEKISYSDMLQASANENFDNIINRYNASIKDVIGQNIYVRKRASSLLDAPASDPISVAIPARPPAPTRSVDTTNEKVTIPAGYYYNTNDSSYTAGGWVKVESDTAIDVSPGKSIYIYKAAVTTGDNKAFKSEVQTLIAPARAEKPAVTINNYAEETLSTTAAMQWRTDEGAWQNCTEKMNASVFDWRGSETTVKFRTKATASNYASEEVAFKIPARPDAPELTIDTSKEGVKLSDKYYYNTTSAEYSEATWNQGNDSVVAVSPNSTIYIYSAAITTGENPAFKSKVQTLRAPGKETVPTNINIDYKNETLSTTTTMQWQNDTGWKDCDNNMNLSDLGWTGSEKKISFRTKATENLYASDKTNIDIPARPDAPANVKGTDETSAGRSDGKITGVTKYMEYKAEKDAEWKSCTESETEIENLAPGKYQVRYKAKTAETPQSFASKTVDIVIKRGASIPTYYVLKFNTNGGSSISSVSDTYGTSVDLTLDKYIPTREGYTFSGWYTDEKLTERITSINLYSSQTIYAGWTPIPTATPTATPTPTAAPTTAPSPDTDTSDFNPSIGTKFSSAKAVNGTAKVTLTWKKVKGADGYQIYWYNRKTEKYERMKTVLDAKVTTYTTRTLTYGQNHYFKIRAFSVNKKGNRTYGKFGSSVKIKTGPAATTAKTVKSTKKQQVTVTWKKVSNADGYQIYRSTSKNGTYTKMTTTTGNKTHTKTLKNQKSGKKYYYKVRAYITGTDGKRIYGKFSTPKSVKIK